MAAPFYSQVDQDIYASGNRFIPQEQYRLGPYTPPEIMGQNTNAGITNTQAAVPYIWPPQGGGGGGGGGQDDIITNTYNVNQNLGSTNITDYEAEADDVGPTFRGSLARLQDLYSRLPTPTNLLRKGVRHWKTRRAEKKAEEAAASKAGKDAADAAAVGQGTNIGGGWTQTNTGGGGATFTGGGGQTHQGWSNTPAGFAAAAASEASFAQGGRIGYERGRVVNPGGYSGDTWQEFLADKSVFVDPRDKNWREVYYRWLDKKAQGGRIGYRNGEFVEKLSWASPAGAGFNLGKMMGEKFKGSDENVMMASDENNTRILENLFEKYLDLGFSPEDAEIKAMEEFELMSQGQSQDQGIASLV